MVKEKKLAGSKIDAAGDVDLYDVNKKKTIQKVASNIDKGVKNTVFSAIGNIHDATDAVRDLIDKDDLDAIPEEIDGTTVLSTTAALRIIYYLMAVNGEIYHTEEEKYNLIGEDLDPYFKDNREKIIKRCQTQMEKAKKQDDYYSVIKRGVTTAISLSKPTKDSFITPKLLIWDLLSVAYSDDQYDDAEKKLIRFIVKKLNVNEAEFLEMESSFLTLIDIQRESDWIKTTDRQYKEIEKVVNELADRKAVILESVHDLITL